MAAAECVVNLSRQLAAPRIGDGWVIRSYGGAALRHCSSQGFGQLNGYRWTKTRRKGELHQRIEGTQTSQGADLHVRRHVERLPDGLFEQRLA